MPNSDAKLAEGLKCLRDAEKCLKTSLFKWSPDYDGAAADFKKAAIAFKNAKANEQAVSSYMKAADAFHQNGSAFHAAKSMEDAAMIHKENKEFDQAAELIERASALYLEHGTPDTAVLALERAAKVVESTNPERAIHLYTRACETSEMDDKLGQAASMSGKAARLLIRYKKYEEAILALRREIDFYAQIEGSLGTIYKLMFPLVLLHIHLGDTVAADKAFKTGDQYNGFSLSEEATAISRLLQAYDESDPEGARDVLRSALFRYMENDFTKLARDAPLPKGLSMTKDLGNPEETSGNSIEDEDLSGLR